MLGRSRARERCQVIQTERLTKNILFTKQIDGKRKTRYQLNLFLVGNIAELRTTAQATAVAFVSRFPVSSVYIMF